MSATSIELWNLGEECRRRGQELKERTGHMSGTNKIAASNAWIALLKAADYLAPVAALSSEDATRPTGDRA